ncbi:MAG: RNA polymerase sigma factor [Actinomycetota bacterium]|nr:RNA polymerase sigma factor [Actinomycetota bacterium]
MGREAHGPQGDPLTRRSGSQPGSTRVDVGATDVVELSRRARAGDHRALGPLVQATYDDAYGVALRMLGDEHDAGDAVQEAYLRALRGIRRFRGEAAFTTWLHRITANCAADVLARRSRTAHRDLDSLATDRDALAGMALADTCVAHDPEARTCQRADREELVVALGALPDGLRTVVVLRDVYDLSHEAIAAELGISVSAAKVRLHRGRRRLRELLFPPECAGTASSGIAVGGRARSVSRGAVSAPTSWTRGARAG